MRVLLSGGGTGGHIYPALAIGAKIKAQDKNSVIEYVGTEKGLESKLVPKEGYKIHYVKVQGLKRKLSAENIKALVWAFTSVIEAKKIIKNFRPDIVIGTGGYVCWPVLKAAADMKIPTLVHESNAVPGVATKMLAPYVSKILVNFKETAEMGLPEHKVQYVGNPIKPEMFMLDKQKARENLGIAQDAQVVLSFGGSLGAKRINEVIFDLLSDGLLPESILHFHATGAGYWDAATERFIKEGYVLAQGSELVRGNRCIKKYIYNMPEMLAAADVVICRAGAMTVSEVSATGKAAIMIPSPNVTDNHQYKNAHVLESAGAAKLIEEKELTPEKLSEEIVDLLKNPEKTALMKEKIHRFAVPDCLDRIYDIIREMTN